MLLYKKLDITTVEKGIVAHGVNGQFVMGSGVALAIKNKWPIVYTEYVKYKDFSFVSGLLGDVQFVNIDDKLIVANCFTQMYYGNTHNVKYARPEAVKTCLQTCIAHCNALGLDLYMPRIGCGLGGLSWSDEVLPIVENVSEKLSGNLMLYVCDL